MIKFTKKYYKCGVNHFQIWFKKNSFLEVKLHKDGTCDLHFTNPIYTKPKLGNKIDLPEIINEKPITKFDHKYIYGFFDTIERMAKQSYKKNK